MYKSPIELIQKDFSNKLEDYVMECVTNTGVKINKAELIKALTDSKQFYNNGYADGIREFNKYKWHDLRKDSNNLPNDWDNVLVYGPRLGYVVAYIIKKQGWYIYYNDEFIYCGVGAPDIIAWKEIEPFEV